jgi:hypothetical protein
MSVRKNWKQLSVATRLDSQSQLLFLAGDGEGACECFQYEVKNYDPQTGLYSVTDSSQNQNSALGFRIDNGQIIPVIYTGISVSDDHALLLPMSPIYFSNP